MAVNPSTTLVNIAGILVFALLVAGAVWAGLRLFLHRDPDAPTTDTEPKPPSTLMRGLVVVGELLLVVTVLLLVHAAQTAFGAPVGERSSAVLEVVEVRECDGTLTGFGLVQSCEMQVYSADAPIGYSEFPGPVVGGEPIEPGDRVARYSTSGWVRWLQAFNDDPQWRSLDDEGKPNLVWLPIVALFVGIIAAQALGRRLTQGRAATDGSATG